MDKEELNQKLPEQYMEQFNEYRKRSKVPTKAEWDALLKKYPDEANRITKEEFDELVQGEWE